MHILLAEDSPMIAQPTIHALESHGHRVTHVTDGAAAVAQYKIDPPDLVLMDVVMPNMDGIEAVRLIKAIPVKRWIPITMLTALTSDADLIRALEAGADDYITKPVNFDVLIARLRSKQRVVDMQNSLFGVLENVHEGILTIDQHGIVQRFNLAAERIFGYSSREVMGRNVNMLMPEPYHTQHDGYLHNYLATHQPKVIGMGRKVEGRRKNGDVFPMHLAVTQVESVLGVQFIGLVRDISREEEDRQKIEYMVTHDALTGLNNRNSLSNVLSEYVRRVQSFAVLFIDIDGFKPVNDTFGHDIGDQVLIAIAQRMCSVVASSDTIARLGGDEFIVVLPDVADSSDVEQVATRLLERISMPMNFDEISCRVGASIGAALFPEHAHTAEKILQAADGAMYKAKQAGKNRIVMYQSI